MNQSPDSAAKERKQSDVTEDADGHSEQVKKAAGETPGEITVGDLNIVLDASPSHELESIEFVVKSHQERLLELQKAREGLKPLEQLGDTEGIKCLAVESNGIPERILFKIS